MSTRTCVLICVCSGMHSRTQASTHITHAAQYLFSHSCMHARTHIITHDHTHTQAHTHKKHANTHTAIHTHTLWYARVDRILGQDLRKPSENRGTRVPQIQEVYLSTSCKRASSLGPLRSLHAHTFSFPLHPGPSPSTSVVF
jgi:hypothetical protein